MCIVHIEVCWLSRKVGHWLRWRWIWLNNTKTTGDDIHHREEKMSTFGWNYHFIFLWAILNDSVHIVNCLFVGFPYCAILSLVNSKSREVSWGTTDGGRVSTRESSYDKSEREYVFPAPHSRLLHNARRSAEPRAITLAPFSLQSHFYS